MNDANVPIFYLPLAWIGVLGTSLTYRTLARARVDRSWILTALHIRNEFTAAICLYGIWTLAAALVLFYLMARRGVTPAAVGLQGRLSVTGTVLAVGGAAFSIALWPIVQQITRLGGGGPVPGRWLDRQRSNGLGLWDFVLLCSCGVIIVPALEEFIFRGYVIAALREHVSTSVALLLASIIFASIHVFYGRGVVLYAFVLSVMLSALFLFCGNLYPPILMHSLVNFFGFVAAPILFSQSSR
jgi:membrane protease YdiL (CAAX protease family)